MIDNHKPKRAVPETVPDNFNGSDVSHCEACGNQNCPLQGIAKNAGRLEASTQARSLEGEAFSAKP